MVAVQVVRSGQLVFIWKVAMTDFPTEKPERWEGGVMFIQPLHQALSSDFLRESAQGVERCLSEGPPPSLRDP